VFAEVLVFQLGMHQAFTYAVPAGEKLVPGDLVALPFGKGNRLKKGLVIESKEEHQGKYVIKPILGRFPSSLTLSSERLSLLLWIRKEYFSPFYEAARLFFPEYAFASYDLIHCESGDVFKENEPFKQLVESENFLFSIQEKVKKKQFSIREQEVRLIEPLLAPSRQAKKQNQVFQYLIEQDDWTDVTVLMEFLKLDNTSVLKAMQKKGMIEFRSLECQPVSDFLIRILALTHAQEAVFEEIQEFASEKPILLHGVTGSGKTEIYFHLIDEILAKGKTICYLIPEIALTPQMIDRIQSRFPVSVAVLHSRLSVKERKLAWQRISKGQVSMVLGTRSALFSPMQNLGLIIVDECHDRSYHSQSAPRFRADQVAVKLGDKLGAPVILGSATPTFEQYQAAQSAAYHYTPLRERAKDAVLPSVEVIDLREELKQGNRSMISRRLYEEMKETLARKEQVILFLNRRGFSGFISCRACGEALKCSHCDVSLTYHHEDGSLRCHLCGRRFPKIRTCPDCGSTWLKPFSAGTQKLEGIVQKTFPESKIVRMDYDTTRSKESFQDMYETIKSGNCDIVIGTQMIAKGWDFPKVTLIGVLAADLSLYGSNYDAAEQTYQLLDQVSGRAGRGQKAGHVVLQTYSPHHYAIEAVANHSSDWFYQNEQGIRQILKFPPFGHLLTVFGSSRREDRLEQGIQSARQMFLKVGGNHADNIQIGEPIPSRISKADGYFRKEFIIQIPVGRIEEFRDQYFQKIETPLIGLRSEGCQISVLWNEEA
jgi:primosomal protein N' (replication factor Y)